MNKTLAIIIASVVTLGLSAAVYSYSQKADKYEAQTIVQEQEIEKLEEDNRIKDQRIAELEVKVSELEERVAEYRQKIDRLEAGIRKKDKDISWLNRKIRDRNATIDKLRKEITDLSRSREDNSELIRQLEAEKARNNALKNKLEEQKLQSTIKREKLSDIAAAEAEQQKIEEMRLKRIADITQNTNFAVEKVELREHKEAGKMRKIKTNKWRYTNIQFYLQHKDGPRNIMDEDFAVVLRDLDTAKVLPFNEGNPVYPGSKLETGIQVKYNGNMFEVDYYNSEPKKGENFAVEVSYVLNGEHYPLVGGSKKIIADGKVIKL